jgi:short-subunit dehydrogenase
LARRAASDGRRLILVGSDADRLHRAAEELRRTVTAHVIVQDLSQPGAAENVYRQVNGLSAEVDCLINNAGFGDYGEFADADLVKQERMIAVNVIALTSLTRLFLPDMLRRGTGNVLNLASVTGFVPGPLMSVYFATKHYVLAFSESLAEELRHSGVRVTALCPPPVRTSFVETAGVASANYIATTRVGPAEVARFGYAMMQRGRVVAVYSLRYKILTYLLVRITPRFALRRLLHRLNRQGIPAPAGQGVRA